MASDSAEEMEILRDERLVGEMAEESAAEMVAKTDNLMAAVTVSKQVHWKGLPGV